MSTTTSLNALLVLLLVAICCLASAQRCRHSRESIDFDHRLATLSSLNTFSPPLACKGINYTEECCFWSIQDAIGSNNPNCSSKDIYLDPGVFTHDCAVYNVSKELNFLARSSTNKPIIEAAFDFDSKLQRVENMVFRDIIWTSSRAIRVRQLEVRNLTFEGCEFRQEAANEVMLKMDGIKLVGDLTFNNCLFSTSNLPTGSSNSWASFAMTQTKNPDGNGWMGNFIMNKVEFTGSLGVDTDTTLMEIDVNGARNFHLSNSKWSRGATLYISDCLEVKITNSTFESTGITSTTSSNITVEGCTFSKIQVLNRNRSPYARCIHFKDASPPGTGYRKVSIRKNVFKDFIPETSSEINIGAVSFSASPARIYFDSVILKHNQFIGFERERLYSVMDEDFAIHIDAQQNWWGSATGPRDGCNRKGTGAHIWWDRPTLRTNVEYRPWCSSPSCTSLATNGKNCPWPAWKYAVVVLSSVLGLALVVVLVLAIRQYLLGREYTRLAGVVEEEYHSRLLRRVKNLDELCAKYNVRRLLFSQFEIGERIGEGTFGYVHKAMYHPRDEIMGFTDLGPSNVKKAKIVAVKYLKNRWLEANYDSIGNFLDEIKIMSMVEHPHVQSLIGLAVDEDENICMISDFMSRGSLGSVLDSDELTPSRKLDISLDTAYGMAHLHSKGMKVVHRDLKPGNILISEDWVAKVADFGTSVATINSIVASAIGTTPVYLSPEASLHNEFSEKSDVFAYGITIYELWAQEISYPSLTSGGLSVIQDYAKRRAPPELPLLKSLPPTIAKVIVNCTRFYPEDRPTFDDILSILVSSREKLREGKDDSDYDQDFLPRASYQIEDSNSIGLDAM